MRMRRGGSGTSGTRQTSASPSGKPPIAPLGMPPSGFQSSSRSATLSAHVRGSATPPCSARLPICGRRGRSGALARLGRPLGAGRVEGALIVPEHAPASCQGGDAINISAIGRVTRVSPARAIRRSDVDPGWTRPGRNHQDIPNRSTREGGGRSRGRWITAASGAPAVSHLRHVRSLAQPSSCRSACHDSSQVELGA